MTSLVDVDYFMIWPTSLFVTFFRCNSYNEYNPSHTATNNPYFLTVPKVWKAIFGNFICVSFIETPKFSEEKRVIMK